MSSQFATTAARIVILDIKFSACAKMSNHEFAFQDVEGTHTS